MDETQVNYLRLSPEDYSISEDEANQADTTGAAFYRAKQAMSADGVVQEIRDEGGQASVVNKPYLSLRYLCDLRASAVNKLTVPIIMGIRKE